MPRFVRGRITCALNDHGKALRGSRMMLVGVAYKKDVDDLRESPALRIINRLQKAGGSVSYHDPYVPQLPKTRAHDLNMASQTLTDAHLHSLDAVLIIPGHTPIDYARLAAQTPLTIDTRNATRLVTAHPDRIVAAEARHQAARAAAYDTTDKASG